MARRKARTANPDSPRVLAYCRVSTAEQADSRAGLDAQKETITRDLESRGWADVRWLVDAGHSAKSLDRPALQDGLAALTGGQADVLIVSKLDRLSRSLPDFVDLMQRATHEGWRLVTLDCQVDTASPTGALTLNVLACFSDFERRLIGQRTKEGLAAKKAQGVRLGRPAVLSAEVARRIANLRAKGMTYAQIAELFSAESVPTARGGSIWYPSSVRAVAISQDR